MFFKKNCPGCSQKVSKGASVCENCGYEFEKAADTRPPFTPYTFMGQIYLDAPNGTPYEVTDAVEMLRLNMDSAAATGLKQKYRFRIEDAKQICTILKEAIELGMI